MKEPTKPELLQESVSNKVLITGIDGFTGCKLEQKLLEKGYDVFGTVLIAPTNNHHIICDLRNQKEIDSVIQIIKPDYIFHLAGISFVGEKDRALIYEVNVIGTENLFDAITNCKLTPQKIIVASSATVYGNQNTSILDETMCPKPVNHYGYSKLIMEHIVARYFENQNIIITRPFNYTGPEQSKQFLIPKIISHFKEKKEFIELGNTNVAREFNNVSDISNIYSELMKCPTESTIVNLCSGKEIYLTDIIEYLNKIAGYNIKIKVNPELVRTNEIAILKGSNERLLSIISYNFVKDIYSTLNEMYNFS